MKTDRALTLLREELRRRDFQFNYFIEIEEEDAGSPYSQSFYSSMAAFRLV